MRRDTSRQHTSRWGRGAAFGGTLALAFAATIPAHAATNVGSGPLDPGLTPINVLAINDFHGYFTKDFACTVTSTQAANPGSLFVSAGDNVGGTPFVSASQNDEPAIDYLNSLDLEMSAVGNHEFDKGAADLTGRISSRANWDYLGANVYRAGTQTPALPEYSVETKNGVRVATIGAVTSDVPNLVSKGGIAGLEFGDPVAAVNRVATQLTDGDEGNGEADVIIAAYHEGAPSGDATIAQAVASSTTFSDIVNKTSPKVSAILTGHTHQEYAWDGPLVDDGTRPIIQTDYYSKNLGMLTLGYDKASGQVTQYRSRNIPVTAPTPACEADARYRGAASIVDQANKKAEEIGGQQIGTLTNDITTAFTADGKRDDRTRESTLSNLIAQSYVDSINKPGRAGGVDIGVMNPGGVRNELRNDDGGKITYSDAASIMPFNNTIVTKEFTGAQLVQALEQQWQPEGSSRTFLKLGLSKNVTYTFDPDAAAGKRITSVMVNGAPMDPAKTYKVASNSFLLAGGDNFTAFEKGANTRDSGLIDQSLFVEWIKEKSPLSPSFAKQAVAIQNQPSAVKAGEQVSFTVSGLDLSSIGSPKNTSLAVSLVEPGSGTAGAAIAAPSLTNLGTFPVASVSSTTPPYPSRDGSANVTVTIPAGTASGTMYLRLAAAPSGTVSLIPIQVTGVTPPPTTSGPAPTTSAPSPTVSGPPVETGQTGGGSNTGAAGIGIGLITALGGAYVVLRRRLNA